MPQEVIYKYYGLNGQESTHDKALARYVKISGLDKYFVLHFVLGPGAGHPVDPTSPDFSEKLIKPDQCTGESFVKFRPVEKEYFDIYLKFLAERNGFLYRTLLNLGGTYA